ncbi:SH3 domain-containing protein [Calothrix sp. NIES-2098]|uniref:SH3 domain-containing protein n=1 Tax=Calothrix sp. NIES-2098 TaxID=1954171 RepID=UPI000B614DD1|nr:SH3 type 3 domain protein [Calothrix sp. NIES-2098]
MFKLFMAGALIFSAALPVGAQEIGSKGVLISQIYSATICTNDVGGTLNLRTGPGTNYRVIRQIPNGNDVRVIRTIQNSNGIVWFLVNYGNSRGWIDARYTCPPD